MSNVLLPLALCVIVLGIPTIQSKDKCLLRSPVNYMKWVEEDGSLVFPKYRYKDKIVSDTDEDESQYYFPSWEKMNNSNSCVIDGYNKILKCEGKDIKHLPLPEKININYIKQYIVSFASLAPLPPNTFKNLNITDLIIENSSLTFISADVFKNIASLSTLTISGNNIITLNDIEHIFNNVPSIKAVYLENNQLRNLNCYFNNNKYLENLELLSLAYNPLELVNFQCLNQSNLKYLNLKGVEITEKEAESMRLCSLPTTLTTLDLSFSNVTTNTLNTLLFMLSGHNITTLGLAGNKLKTIPIDSLKHLNNSLRYLSLNGNSFYDNSFYLRMDSTGTKFQVLQELDLRSCKIETIDSTMLGYFPNLEKLTLANNILHIIESNLLTYSSSLKYLDISENKEAITFSYVNNEHNMSSKLKVSGSSLKVFELSNNIFNSSQNWDSYNMTLQLLTKLETLSLCSSTLNVGNINGLSNLFTLTNLDVSSTLKNDITHLLIPAFKNLFYSLYNLKELQFANNEFNFGYNSVSMFTPLQSLTLLNLSDNSITKLQDDMFCSLFNLKDLLLHENFITSWNSNIFNTTNHVQNIDLSKNQITLITTTMVEDFTNLKTLNLKNNPLICNKLTNNMICGISEDESKNLKIVDWEEYTCLDQSQNKYFSFKDGFLCSGSKNVNPGSSSNDQSSKIFTQIGLYMIPVCVIIFIVLGFIAKTNWWSIKHYITLVKQSGTRYLLKNSNSSLNNNKYIYDVFVSYSDIDRAWVLDHLIPNIEKESSMSVCFHERDFQVGLSILENIVESIGKSRCLLLVISESFVKSRWCQFEMHLAQHHAVETKKDQLVMVLLENIPKKNRPKTLHHLMCTRTYLIWPKQPSKEDSIELFWKRLHRAIKPDYIDTPIYITM